MTQCHIRNNDCRLTILQKVPQDFDQGRFWNQLYDPCVANKMVNGKQQTICWHVDDCKLSHRDKRVNGRFILVLACADTVGHRSKSLQIICHQGQEGKFDSSSPMPQFHLRKNYFRLTILQRVLHDFAYAKFWNQPVWSMCRQQDGEWKAANDMMACGRL